MRVANRVSGILLDRASTLLNAVSAKPGEAEAMQCLGRMAASGACSAVALDEFVTTLPAKVRSGSFPVACYLASLYLLEGDESRSVEMLRPFANARREMNRFAALLIFRRRLGLSIPRLSVSEHACLDYLEQRLVDGPEVLAEVLQHSDGIAVYGNAPGAVFPEPAAALCTFMFNDYRCNPRIAGTPRFHVVTPAFKMTATGGASHLMITGNSIFHRRSHVWRRFMQLPRYTHIHVFPRALWSRLYNRLDAPPSAGALVIACLVGQQEVRGKQAVIGGFSLSDDLQNHAYDNTPKSARHNWPAERELLSGLLCELRGVTSQLDLMG